MDEKAKRGFYHLAESWNARCLDQRHNVTDEVTFGLYHQDGGTIGEMHLEWVRLQSRPRPCPKLCVFDDAFELLAVFWDLFEDLARRRDMKPKEFCELLKEHRFQDLSQRKRPQD